MTPALFKAKNVLTWSNLKLNQHYLRDSWVTYFFENSHEFEKNWNRVNFWRKIPSTAVHEKNRAIVRLRNLEPKKMKWYLTRTECHTEYSKFHSCQARIQSISDDLSSQNQSPYNKFRRWRNFNTSTVNKLAIFQGSIKKWKPVLIISADNLIASTSNFEYISNQFD
jgi:hypothetical protein